MKKNLFLIIAFSISISAVSFAQVSTTPEVPKNYKPAPKELVPMPGELTDEMIFPVLGKYEYTDNDGNISNVTISRDSENKGSVWVNGMSQGKFKADLRISPATYKIPGQKTLQNDQAENIAAAVNTESDNSTPSEETARYSGKSLDGGTLIFDSSSSKLYVNIDGKYDEENPASVFPEIIVADSATSEVAINDNDENDNQKPSDKKKEVLTKGTTYVLTKIIDVSATSSLTPANK